MHNVSFSLTTDAGGDVTSTSSQDVSTRLVGVYVKQGTLAATSDITISVTNTDTGDDQTLLTITNSSASSWYFPRTQACDAAASAIAGEYVYPVAIGNPKVVVAQGGNATSGNVYLYFE